MEQLKDPAQLKYQTDKFQFMQYLHNYVKHDGFLSAVNVPVRPIVYRFDRACTPVYMYRQSGSVLVYDISCRKQKIHIHVL